VTDFALFLLHGVLPPLAVGSAVAWLATTYGWPRPMWIAFIASLLLISAIFGIHDFIAYGPTDTDRLARAIRSAALYLPGTAGLSLLALVSCGLYLRHRRCEVDDIGTGVPLVDRTCAASRL
jgi:hypothetical protein